jgi:hypothetical protein
VSQPRLRSNYALADTAHPSRQNASCRHPRDAGVYSVLITNAFGSLTSSITSQSSSLAALVGASADFEADIAGTGPLACQWYFNGSVPIPGAANTSLTVDNVTTNNAGRHCLVVSNAFGSAVSSQAVLSVYLSATSALSAFSAVPGVGARFTVSGVPGLQYIVQASTNLVNWVTLGTNTPPFEFFDPSSANLPKCFYRAVYTP